MLEYLVADPLRTSFSMIATKQATIKDGVCQRRWQESNHSNPFLRIFFIPFPKTIKTLRSLLLKARHWFLLLVLVVVVFIHFSICGVNFLEVDLLCDHSQR